MTQPDAPQPFEVPEKGYPVRSGRLFNYVGFVPTKNKTIESWSAIGDRDELAASFGGWDPRVVGFLEKVETCFWWGLYDRRPLASWTMGRLALLGDAAHAMLPHLGQGANQAIEDGVAVKASPARTPLLNPTLASTQPSHIAIITRTDMPQPPLTSRGERHQPTLK